MISVNQALTVVIGGQAGQGLATIGELLVKSLVRSGYHLVVTQDYLSRIRGGLNAFVIRVGPDEVFSPVESVDLLIALSLETIDHHLDNIAAGGLIVADAGYERPEGRVLEVPYKELVEGRYSNIAALGIAGAALGIDPAIIAGALEEAFGREKPRAAAQNSEALARAYAWCRGRTPGHLKLRPVSDPPERMAMNGNEAIALGALAAGLKFCSFYPMTPSTSIALNLAARSEKMGLVVEQAEDEIAAINMALGASFAGTPSLVTTSGGGFALMGEGVSLAAMTETPVVVAVIQRPGPATGLPTRTEQADLEFVLHSGHGEFPRAVFAPGSVEECFHLTRRAFDLAERFQGPVFILSDQFMADSYRAVRPFNLDQGPRADPAAVHRTEFKTPYTRYTLTEDGVSPRLLPGLSEHLVVADSDEHTQDGHLTEDLEVRKLMNDKRLKKLEGLKKEVVPPEYSGDDRPDLLFVCWGSSRGSVLEAAAGLRSEGRKAGVLHFSQVWPLIPEQFLDRFEEAGQVVGVESNAFGQMARLIRRETGFEIERKVLRYDGLPLTPKYIRLGLAD